MQGKTIKQLENTYELLYERLLRGELTDDEFKAEVDQLRIKDDEGRLWKAGWYTGQWYRFDEGQWVPGRPAERQAVDAAAASAGGRRARTLTPWLLAALVILLLSAGTALVLSWNADSGGGSVAALVTATPVQQSAPILPPATPSREPTATEPAATPPTAAPRRPAATSRPTATPTATVTTVLADTTAAPGTATTTAAGTATAPATAAASPTPLPTATRPAPASPTPQPATASLTGRIFFPVYDRDPTRRTFDIYAVRLSSGRRELVAGQASQPALSRDGKRLAYRSWDKGQRGIMVLELTDGRTWRWIEAGEAARPSWSPDSQNIIFPSRHEADRLWRIYRTAGPEFSLIRRNGSEVFGRVPVWLADGRIVYWDCPLANCGLYVMQGDGTSPARLTTAEHDTGPAASPDGQQLAFASDRSGNWEIHLVVSHPSAGAEVRRLTQNGARDGLPAWSPDGKWLAFASDRDGVWAVWAIRPDGSGLQRLFDLGGPPEGEVADAEPGAQDGWPSETMAWGP